MKHAIICALLALSLLACTGKVTHIQAAQNVPDTALEVAIEVRDELCDATAGQDCFTFDREPSDSVLLLADLDTGRAGRAIEFDGGNVWILLDSSLVEPKAAQLLRRVLRHELGHVAGCWRHPETGAITRSDMDAADGYTDDDVRCMRVEQVSVEELTQGGTE